MELLNALNEMEEIIETGFKVPMTRKVMVDEELVLDMMDRIRTTLPEEIRQAKWIIQEREKVMSDTKKEAGKLLEDVQKEMERQVDENEITRLARKKSEEIIERAEMVAQEIKQGARDYADEILQDIEMRIEVVNKEIQDARMELQGLRTSPQL
ncbi:MAG: ATPase [Peptococcaceae bacterium]|nr:ATPase [Peptococcaceae bacterium]